MTKTTKLTNGKHTYTFTNFGTGGVNYTKTFGPKGFVVGTGAFTDTQAEAFKARLANEGYEEVA